MLHFMDESYMMDLLEDWLQTPSPTGFTHILADKVEMAARQLGYAVERNAKGGVLISVPGGSSHSRGNVRGVLGLSAHIDTLGAMVRSVHAGGTIRFTPIGGYMMQSIEGEYCQIHTRDGRSFEGTILSRQPSVHVYPEARTLERTEENMEIRLDEPVGSKKDVHQLGIRTGDFISFDPRTRMLPNGYIKSRHLDDKAGAAAIFGMLKAMREHELTPSRPVNILISNYEEVGHGAAALPPEVNELIAVDMGAIGDDLNTTERDVSICAKDSGGPYDYFMVSELIRLAERHQLRYAIDIYPRYGSDATAALRAGHNLRAALVGPGVHASHGMERTHRESMLHTAALLTAYTVSKEAVG